MPDCQQEYAAAAYQQSDEFLWGEEEETFAKHYLLDDPPCTEDYCPLCKS